MISNPDVLDSYNVGWDSATLITAGARSVDTVLDSAVGLAPAEPIINVIHDILPANVIHNVTKLPKPSKYLNGVFQDISHKLENFRGAGSGVLPALPSPKDLLP
jgi:hypothetical protein